MKKIILVIALSFHAFLLGQGNPHFSEISDRFETYSELPREVVYVHLNKSTYIKGEQLGFKAYVFDKDQRLPSLETNNLYCVVVSDAGEMISKQLIRIDQGVGSGLIKVDSLFSSGTYRFRAYTNWMRNFSEPNYFEQQIRILDPETDVTDSEVQTNPKVDAQFLPEGGHAVAGLDIVYGAIVKDQNGFGIPLLEGTVMDEQDTFVTNFKLNAMGIGRFGFPAQSGKQYFVHFTHDDKAYKIPLGAMKAEGIVMKLQELRNQVGLIFSAKFRDEQFLKGPYLLTIHNGDALRALDLSFDGKEKLIRVIPKEDLFPGVNVFTLFNSKGQPILERLYFNQNNIPIISSLPYEVTNNRDSLEIEIKIRDVNPGQWNSLSLSVLPGNTISYKGHYNLPAYHLLRPYLKGTVENAAYYFRDPSPKKAFELDNLLITQGWSSYDWNTIFNKPPGYLFDFEKGLSYRVQLNQKQESQFYIFPTRNHTSQLLKLDEDKQDFGVDQFFPLEDEKLGISEISKKGGLVPPKVFIQFKPSAVPEFTMASFPVLGNNTSMASEQKDIPILSFESLENVQQLDEVLVIQDRTQTRLERLKNRTTGKVDLFEEDDPRRNQFLGSYLNSRGFIVNEYAGDFFITARNPNSPNNAQPIIYLDGVLLNDFNILFNFRLDIVDYIEINPSGVGGGMLGGGGIIKIVTDPYRRSSQVSAKAFTPYPIPLTFQGKKRFYNPVYSSYSSGFFQKYGTIDWLPELQLNEDGSLGVKIKNHGLSDIKFFLEGVVNGSEYVSDVIAISPD